MVFYSESSDQDVCDQAPLKANFEQHNSIQSFTDDDLESSLLKRQNQVIKAIFQWLKFLISVASASIGGM